MRNALHDLPLRPGHRPLSPSAVLAAQLRQSLRLLRLSSLIQSMGVLGLLWHYWDATPREILLAWAAAALLSVWSWTLYRVRFRRTADPQRRIRALLRTWMGLAVFSGIVWGAAGVLFLRGASSVDQLLTACGIVAIVFASLPAYACWVPGLTAFTLLSFTPMAAELAADYRLAPMATALVLLLITGYVIYAGVLINDLVQQAMRRKEENRRLADRLKAEKTMAESARRATAAESAKRARFFAAANHDLRQPLQAMGIYLQLLQSTVQEPQREIVAQLDASAKSISTLVEQLLEISRIETGSLEVRTEPVSVKELFASLEAEFAPQARARGLVFECRSVPGTVTTDSFLITRVLRNLLANAVRYTNTPGARIELSAAAGDDGVLRIRVRDEGEGMSAEEQERIWDTFFRGEAGKKSAGGFGLGLSIVRGITQRLDVPLALESAPGRGTVFTLSFYDYGAACAHPPSCAAAAVPAAAHALHGTVGVLEDNPLVRRALRAMLEGWGARVIEAARPDTGFLERMAQEARGGALRGLVSDYNLGSGLPTGLETIFLVREAGAGRDFPAVLLTAVPEDAIRRDYRMLCLNPDNEGQPMPAIVQKPATPDALARALGIVARPEKS